MATVLRVGRTTVYDCVKSKSYEKCSKPNIYKPKKIDEFSQDVSEVEQYQSDGQDTCSESESEQ